MGYSIIDRSARLPRPPFEGFAPRSEAVALLLERVGVVVVAVALPEAGPVLAPSARSRAATWRSSRSTSRARSAAAASRARALSGSPSAWVASIAPSRSRNSTGTLEVKPASACAIAKRAARARAGELAQRRPGDALEGRVEPAPARDAVDVLRHLDPRQLAQLLPGQRQRRVDLAGDREVPAREVGRVLGDRAGVKHRPLLGQVLARRQPRRVVSRLPHLLLGLAPEHAPTLDRVSAQALQAAIRPRAYVGVTGTDAASYLQRMVSNDVEALGPGEACQALLLTAKARLIAPLTVLRRGADDFLLLTEPSLGERVAAELTRFRFAAKCAIEAEEHVSTIVLGGPPPDGSIPTPDYGVPAYELDRRRRARAEPLGEDELERLRILARTPAWGRELDDRVLPAEAGLEEHAISFTKGCYPGPGAGRPPALPRPSEPRPARARARGRRAAGLRRGAQPRRQGRSAGSRAPSPTATACSHSPSCAARSRTMLSSLTAPAAATQLHSPSPRP